MLITDNFLPKVTLWKAADLTPIGFFATGLPTVWACSDGLNFWLALNDDAGDGGLGRF